jgi:hypothetical protein
MSSSLLGSINAILRSTSQNLRMFPIVLKRPGLPGKAGAEERQKIEIPVKGYIYQQWSEWFRGLNISHYDPDETLLAGLVPNQAALNGIISRLQDLGLVLYSLSNEDIEEAHHITANGAPDLRAKGV